MRIVILLLLGLLMATSLWSTTVDGRAKSPLDLPSGRGADRDGDDDPVVVITFYGASFEGDGFFWCLDKSGSMAGEMQTLKIETTQSIAQISSQAEFGLVAFSSNTVLWSAEPRKASFGNKSAATEWVNGLTAGGGSCLGPAGVQTCQLAHQSTKRRRQMLFLGDRVPSCGGDPIGEITGANYERIPLHTSLHLGLGRRCSVFPAAGASERRVVHGRSVKAWERLPSSGEARYPCKLFLL